MKSKGASKTKTGGRLDYNWDCLSRDDIYRQRVFGTESGANNFIQTDDKKQRSVLSMIIYIVLILSAMNFVWKGGVIESKFVVTRAVLQWVSNRKFDLMLTPEAFADIDDLDDVKDWLRFALPAIIASPVQQANFPLFGVRFSLRNVLDTNNSEPRFQSLAKVTWKDKAGIRTSAAATASSFTGGYQNDDTESFGAYREYGFNSEQAQRLFSRDNTTAEELQNFSLGLQWCSAPISTCDGELLTDYFYDRSQASSAVVDDCNLKCEQMQRQNRLCHCWTLTTTHCNFYHVPLHLLVSTPPVETPCWNHSSVNVYPTLIESTNGRTSYFPLMKRFVHTSNRPLGGFFAEAYGSTQGFLQGVHYWTQEQVDGIIALKQNFSNSGDGDSPSSQGLMFKQLNDWILGGFLGPKTGYLVVDWMNWNPNHDVVSWVVLKFKVDASGLVSTGRSINHLVIPQKDLDLIREDPNSIFWPGFNVWHGLYILLVAYYFFKEVYELITTGLRYFSFWQLMLDIGVLLHMSVIGLRYYHHSISNFTKTFATDLDSTLALDLPSFENEAVAWSNFLLASCFMMVFLFGGLVQYLSDLFPRISVLVDTVSRSITPVFFLVIILCDVFFAFVIWCNLLFGKTVRDFSNIQVTAISLTEMLFGRLDVVEDLRLSFPITGFFFYLVFMVLFFFILQYLSRAIVLTSFDDATRSFEERQRTKKLLAGDQLASFFKQQVAWAKKVLGLNFRARDLKTAGGMEPYPTQKWGLIPFTGFCAIYVIFISMVLWVPEGHDVVQSLTEALKRPTFSKVNPLSREIDLDMDFDRIETREDVLRWLAVSFSKALYNSSSSDNVLGNYAASPQYKQVVINDWNILLGQRPVRLSLQYDHIVPVSNRSVTARLPVAQLIRGDSLVKERLVKERTELKDLRAQEVLQKYCGNYTEEMGFSCMLSVDPEVTIPALLDMRLKGIATNQTSKMTLDFVSYNGNIDMFFYVCINFDFTTSGYIDKEIKIFPIKLPDMTSAFFPIRLILEILIIAFTVGRLAKCMRAVYCVLLAGIKKGKAGTFGHRLFVAFQVLVFHIVQHPFIVFDFLSGISTVLTLVMWYSFVLLDLTQSFYFAESPEWTPAQCAETGLCSDYTAISKFAQASQQMRFFTQICAANAIFLFLCYQKYLSAFPTGRVIARAMLNGLADILCFFVVMVVLLLGYVAMGHTIFGTIMVDFSCSTLGYSVITCFQMFLGTFRSFAEMRQANSIAYYFYWYTYMVLFRYVLVNMFFAIIAKHFQKEDKAVEEQRLECAAQQAQQAQQVPGESQSMLEQIKVALKTLLGMWTPASQDPNEKALEEDPDAPLENFEDLDPVASPKSPKRLDASQSDVSMDTTEMDDSIADDLMEPNWRFLPDETRLWAVDTAKEIFRFIHEKSRLREELEKHNKEQFDIDHVQEEAETAIQEKAFELGKKAEKVKMDLSSRELRSLKAVHRDQESLAWYIMKREAELKKLEEAGSVKMDRYEKMVNATQLLVASDESQPGPSS